MADPPAPRILVVDDDASIRSVCARMLERRGHRVVTASGPQEALARLDAETDVVLTDLNLGSALDGVRLAARVRAASSADVLLMTGYPDLESAIRALQGGIYDYLLKPFAPGAVEAAVERCLQRRRLSAELQRERRLRRRLRAAMRDLRRSERLKDLFGRIATPEVVNYLVETPEVRWRRGELIEATVLFADIRGSTPFVSTAEPHRAVEALNAALGAAAEAVAESGGVVNKFLGDGLLALFGAPVRSPSHALQAARCAARIREVIASQNGRRARSGEAQLWMGIGVNTGQVIAGCVGAARRQEYSVFGHAVNVAARLEGCAAAGQILLGSATVEAIPEPKPLMRRLKAISLRGVGAPLTPWELV